MTSSTNNWVLIKIIKLASGLTFLPRQWQGCGVSWNARCGHSGGAWPLWCGDADAPSRPCCLWLTGLSFLVWRSDPLGAKVGQEADRASHQPDSQVSLGQAFAPWGSPGNVLDQDANAQCECCRRAVPGTPPALLGRGRAAVPSQVLKQETQNKGRKGAPLSPVTADLGGLSEELAG